VAVDYEEAMAASRTAQGLPIEAGRTKLQLLAAVYFESIERSCCLDDRDAIVNSARICLSREETETSVRSALQGADASMAASTTPEIAGPAILSSEDGR
jgi:hypothetical protein